MSFSTILILIVIGLLSGILSGIMGIGGGLIIIPILLLLGVSQHEAQGTSLAIMLPPIGLLAVYNYYKEEMVKWEYAIIIDCTFIIGGYFGSRYAIHLSSEVLRRVFGIVMLAGALKIIFTK